MPNPYILLSTLAPEQVWYMVLDLKDAFFCLTLTPSNQEYFTYEWKDPELGMTEQWTWTHVPQGF